MCVRSCRTNEHEKRGVFVYLLDCLTKGRQTSDEMSKLLNGSGALNGEEDSRALLSDSAPSYESTPVDERKINAIDNRLVKEVDVHTAKVLLYAGQVIYHGYVLILLVMYSTISNNHYLVIQHCLLLVSWIFLLPVETMRHYLPGQRGSSAIQCLFPALVLVADALLFAEKKYSTWIDEHIFFNAELGSLCYTCVVMVFEIFSYFHFVKVQVETTNEECTIENAMGVWGYLHHSIFDRVLSTVDKELLTKNNLIPQSGNEAARPVWQRALPLLYPQGLDGPVTSNIMMAMTKMVNKLFICTVVLEFASSLLMVTTPVFNKRVLSYLEHHGEYDSNLPPVSVTASMLACFLTMVAQAYIMPMVFKLARYNASRVGKALTIAIIRKSTRLGSNVIDVGNLQTLISTDVTNVTNFYIYIPLFLYGVQVLTFSSLMVLRCVGYGGLVGLALLVLALSFSFYLTRKMNSLNKVIMKLRDMKVKQLHECISGIRIIKYFAWEDSYLSRILKSRRKELFYMLRFLLCDAGSSIIAVTVPLVAAMLTFTFHTAISKQPLTSSIGFTTFSLFTLMIPGMLFAPFNLSQLFQSCESFRRIQSVLASEDIRTIKAHACQSKVPSAGLLKGEVIVERGSFGWKSGPNMGNAILKGIDLHVRSGELVCIYGRIGAGKSSLLLAILKEMGVIQGSVKLNGRVGYVSQSPWIQNATIRDNVVFDHKWDPVRFRRVIEACCLTADLKSFPKGDMTEVGEKGVNCSGGQIQRISLARAVYSNSDILLLDDVLSAVDAKVRKTLFDECIGPKGLLRDKTRILVVSTILGIAKQADKILILDNGRIAKSGSYEDVTHGEEAVIPTETSQEFDEVDEGGIIDDVLEQSVDTIAAPLMNQHDMTEEKLSGSIIVDEHRNTGGLSYMLVYDYFKCRNGRWYTFPAWLFVMLVCRILMFSVLSLAMRDWFGAVDRNDEPAARAAFFLCLAVIGIASVCEFVMGIWSQFISVNASKSIFQRMLESVLGSPICWFDSNPVGRTMNRFSSDMVAVDRDLMSSLMGLWGTALTLAVSLCTSSIICPRISFVTVPLMVAMIYEARRQLISLRSMKRLEAISKSPIYSQFIDMLSGISTVRAYGKEDKFITAHEKASDDYYKVYMNLWLSTWWISTRLRLFFAFAYLFMGSYIITHPGIGAGTAGFILNSVYLTISQIMGVLWNWSEAEMAMNGLERTEEYCHLEQEEDPERCSVQPPPDWPSNGEISVHNLSVKFPTRAEPSLHKISFHVPSGKRLGIVGRTGAGKSTMVNSLFRLVEPMPGSVVKIDGVDISSLNLQKLRSCLSIIPQQPTLFEGTIRSQLDLLDKKIADASMWRALELSDLADFVRSLEGQLDHPIEVGGQNFSLGQRQLMCMARALLCDSPIVIMDEATSSVDYETDKKIHLIMNESFRGTIISIAHRLKTSIVCDIIAVMEAGEIVEFDTPINLLKKRGGKFYSMAKVSEEYDQLVHMAEMVYQKACRDDVDNDG